MKILYVHNDYALPSGEETAAEAIVALLREHGHEVAWHRRSSAEVAGNLYGKVKSFFAGIWNPWEVRALKRRIRDFDPDVVMVQNVYPLLSPSVFSAIKSCGKTVVMRCPNYRLFCPNGLCCDASGQVCEACFGGHEWRCVAKNCAGGRLKSIGYALRGWAARVTRRILDNVDFFLVQTEFQRQKFISQGIPDEKIRILPGIMQVMELPAEWYLGRNVTFVGRVSPEKGIAEFLDAARRLPHIPFQVVGGGDTMEKFRISSPVNVVWTGFLKGEALRQAYLDARILVVPSRCYEGFPNVLVQAMQLERPVIASDLGACASLVEAGVFGEKFQPGNGEDLATVIASLYGDKARCRQYGKSGRKIALARYSRDSIYAALAGVIEKGDET